MRTLKNDGKDESIQVLNGSAEPNERRLPPIQHQGNEVVADAAKATAEPVRNWYRVTKGGSFRDPGGFRAVIRVGKEFDDLNYNLQQLKAQGIQFEPIAASERASY